MKQNSDEIYFHFELLPEQRRNVRLLFKILAVVFIGIAIAFLMIDKF